MSVQTFSPPTLLPRDQANWIAAQRIVGPFAPHAQVSPNMTVAIDPGFLLNGTTLTEVTGQAVGPFNLPVALRVDRIVVNRTSGSASIVSGTEGSVTPPAIPSGNLPVARVFLQNTTVSITNDVIYDERALSDLSSGSTILCRANLNNTDQTGVANNTWTKVNLSSTDFNVGSGFNVANGRFMPSASGYYFITGHVTSQLNTTAQEAASLYKNGSAVSYGNVASNSNGNYAASVSDIIYLNGTADYIELYGYQSTGSAASFVGSTAWTYLTAQKIA